MDKWIKKTKYSIEEEEKSVFTPILVEDNKKHDSLGLECPFLSALIEQCHPSWRPVVLEEAKKEYFPRIIKLLLKEPVFYPPFDSIFRAFSYFDLVTTKVVII
ncbi:hypothetical protein PAEPH01_1899, partial [Pancytospora epiphaga]